MNPRIPAPAAITLALAAILCSVNAEEPVAADARLDALNEQIRQTVLSLRATSDARQQRQAAEQARQTREAYEASLPGVAALDRQVAELIEQIRTVKKQRAAIVRAHRAEIEALDKKVEAAEAAYAAATVRSPEVMQLVKERNRLARQIDQP